MTPTPADNALSALEEFIRQSTTADRVITAEDENKLNDAEETIRTYITSTAGQGGDDNEMSNAIARVYAFTESPNKLTTTFMQDLKKICHAATRNLQSVRNLECDVCGIKGLTITSPPTEALQPHPPQPDKCEGLVKALASAKYMIKGREHTGFIDDAIKAYKETT